MCTKNPDDIRIIAIDFDGTLNDGCYPDCSHPNMYIIRRALEERAKGAKLILWTAREEKDLDDAVNACKSWGLEFDAVNENIPEIVEIYGYATRKVAASEYWDDKAVALSFI